eukprot:91489_1
MGNIRSGEWKTQLMYIKCVDSSPAYKGYPIENMSMKYDGGRSYWCSLNSKNVFLVFDVGESHVNFVGLQKVGIWEMCMAYDCGKISFLTSDDKDGPWLLISSGSGRSGNGSKHLHSRNYLCGKNKRYIKLEFTQVDKGYVGIYYLMAMYPEINNPTPVYRVNKRPKFDTSDDDKNDTK